MKYVQPDLEQLNQEEMEARDKKDWLNIANSAANNLLSAPSAAEIYLNQRRAPINVGLDKIAENIQDPWEKQKKTYEAYKQAKEAKELSRELDPDDISAKAMRAMLIKKHNLEPNALDGFSAKDMMGLYGDPGKIEEIRAQAAIDFENQKKIHQMDQVARLQERNNQNAFELQKIATEKNLEQQKKNDPNHKMASLSGTDKARLDNALMVLKAIDEMGAALDRGDNTKSLVGDNDYTRSARNATEAYGRMQSGGAINKDEEARFEKVLPGMLDTKEMQRKKLLGQRDEMISRIKTLGFSPNDLGYAPKDFMYGMESKSDSVNKANANSKPKIVIQNGHQYKFNEETGQYE